MAKKLIYVFTIFVKLFQADFLIESKCIKDIFCHQNYVQTLVKCPSSSHGLAMVLILHYLFTSALIPIEFETINLIVIVCTLLNLFVPLHRR